MNKDRAFIALGSNMGDKEENIKQALQIMENEPGIVVAAVAPLYRTAPVGYTEQDWFLNTVAEIQTTLKPGELLAKMLEIEDFLGRKRQIRWGPRVVDLDILMYGQHVIKEPGLEIPHPRMLERAFVMVPLAALAPYLIFPGGKTASEIAGELKGQQEMELFK